ncbi:MAG: hypothetical protein LQ346_009060, partial [Caloplaca aetnensis]
MQKRKHGPDFPYGIVNRGCGAEGRVKGLVRAEEEETEYRGREDEGSETALGFPGGPPSRTVKMAFVQLKRRREADEGGCCDGDEAEEGEEEV